MEWSCWKGKNNTGLEAETKYEFQIAKLFPETIKMNRSDKMTRSYNPPCRLHCNSSWVIFKCQVVSKVTLCDGS